MSAKPRSREAGRGCRRRGRARRAALACPFPDAEGVEAMSHSPSLSKQPRRSCVMPTTTSSSRRMLSWALGALLALSAAAAQAAPQNPLDPLDADEITQAVQAVQAKGFV